MINILRAATLNPTLFIYRNELLPSSETFILSQSESISAFRPIYLGLKRVQGLKVPEDRCMLLATGRSGRLGRARLKLLGATAFDLSRLSVLKPALLHAHFGMDATDAMPIAHSLGIPLVVTFHGWDATVRDNVFRRQSIALNLYIRRRPKLARAAIRVLCISEFIRQRVLEKGFSPDKTVVHYVGIDLRKFTPNPTLRRKPIVLFVGRLVEVKGCEQLIRAMEIVQSKIKDVETVVIGDGPLREPLEHKAHSSLRACRFVGGCSPGAVREWMNESRVLCTPSVVAKAGNTEGFGMVFAEAQAMGLPVASFASGGIPEAVEHGVTGLLAPERDTDALAHNIELLLTDAALWRRFSAAGQERVRKLFDLEKQTAKLEQIYHEVLQEHQANTVAS